MRAVFLAAGIMAICTWSAVAQANWTDVSYARSWLSFDPPGLSGRPTHIFEWVDSGASKRTARSFAYLFNGNSNDDAFSHIRVWAVAADGNYYNSNPDFDGRLSVVYRELRSQRIDWIDAQRLTSPSPLGTIEYRRFNVTGNSCVSFGGLFGRVSAIGFMSGRAQKTGTEQVMGYYCAIRGYTLSEADVQVVLSRLSFEGLGKAEGSPPQPFVATPGPAPAFPPPVPTVTADVLKVVLSWEGLPEPLSGTITVELDKATARLEIRLPNQSGVCHGKSVLEKNGTGTWTVECPDGSSGKGSFREIGRTGGAVGEGVDNKGARISFTIGDAG